MEVLDVAAAKILQWKCISSIYEKHQYKGTRSFVQSSFFKLMEFLINQQNKELQLNLKRYMEDFATKLIEDLIQNDVTKALVILFLSKY